MPETPELTEIKRALLEKYLRGEQGQMKARAETRSRQGEAIPPSSPDSRAPIIAIQSGGTKRPFFYFHPHWQGGAFYCFALAQALGADQPFYILEPYRFADLEAPPSIEEMATAYVQSLQSVQPHGPYLLGGFCGAGLIAYEVAQQLCAQGESVDLLVLIDPMAGQIQSIRLLGATIRRAGTRLKMSSGRQLDWFLRWRYLSRTLRGARDEYTQHVEKLMLRWQEEHPQRPSLIPVAPALRLDWFGPFIWSVSAYKPHQYPGRITYFFARENPDGRKLWWGKVTENEQTEIYIIPGTHETCRTDHLQDLAQQLRSCLAKAQSLYTM